MSQEELNNQQDANYVDPLSTADNGEPVKKGNGSASVVGSTTVAVIVSVLFGFVGGMICYGGYWAVYAIAKTKLPLAARVILCMVVTIVFVCLLGVFILFGVSLRE